MIKYVTKRSLYMYLVQVTQKLYFFGTLFVYINCTQYLCMTTSD